MWGSLLLPQVGSHLSAVRSLSRGHGDSGDAVPTVTKLGGGWQDCGENNSQSFENLYQAISLLYNSRQTWFTTPIFRGALDINWTKRRGRPRLSFSVVVCVFALNGWITGCGSVPAWIRRTRGVSLLWGLCEALWGRRLVSGCMFPIGCFCWAKTQWGSGLFKAAVSLFVCVCARVWVVFFCLLDADYITFHWWNTDELISHWCRIILCDQNMNGIWMPVLSKEQISLTTVQAVGKRSTLGIGTGGRKTRTTHTIILCSDLLRFDTDILNDETYSHPNLIVTI